MAENQSEKTIEELAKSLRADPKREAVDSQRGYDWQKWLVADYWLDLEGENRLFVEFAEDLTVDSPDVTTTVQAKDRNESISLGRAPVRTLISEAFERDARTRTVMYTRGQVGNEQNLPLGEPGIEVWRKVIARTTDAAPLKKYLLEDGVLSLEASRLLSAATGDDLIALLSKVDWVTDADDFEGLRDKVTAKVEQRMTLLKIPAASVSRETLAGVVFEHVAFIGAKSSKEQRLLKRRGLDDLLVEHNRRVFSANLPAWQSSIEANLPGDVATKVVTALRDSGAISPPAPAQLSDPALRALETYLRARYRHAVQRSSFPEAHENGDEFLRLGEEVRDPSFDGVDRNLKKEVLLRASRSASVHGDPVKGTDLLTAARQTGGMVSEAIAEARLLEAGGDRPAALRLLRDDADPDARSVVLDMLWKESGGDAVRARLLSGSPLPLTMAGLSTAARAYLENGDLTSARELVEQVPDSELREQPFSLFQRGLLRFASVFPEQKQIAAFSGIPLDVRSLVPALQADDLASRLDEAAEDFSSVVSVLEELGLPRARGLALTYHLWCGLLHPSKKQAAIDRLRTALSSTADGVALAQYALAFDPEFNADDLKARLESRQQLGGLDDNELRAALIITLHEGSAAEVAEFINTHRKRLYEDYGLSGTVSIEVQALAKANEVGRAQRLLDANVAELPEELLPLLRADIAAASGSDQVAVYLEAYAETKNPDALKNAVNVLAARKDFSEHAKRAEELFGLTGEPENLIAAAWSNARANDDEALIRLFAAYPTILVREAALRRNYAWALLRGGRADLAIREAGELKKLGWEGRDLDLELALAVETGQWATLPDILRSFLDPDAEVSGRELLRAAQVAQAAQAGPLLELLTAAVEKAPDDANVLINAYGIVLEEGLEDARPQAGLWFQAAVDLSGPDGPVRTVDLQEIVEHQRARTEGAEKIGAAIADGEMPLVVAVSGAGMSQVQLMLGAFVHNTRQPDPRRKAALALFSGSRPPAALSSSDRVVLDVSALATLGWLGLLPTVLDSFTNVGIAAGTLSEFFNARHRIVQRQKVVIRNAQQVSDAVKSGKLRIVPPAAQDDALAKEVGTELCALLRAAEASSGAVVHPPPVHRLGSFTENATLDGLGSYLSDMHGLVATLANGAVSAEQEETARQYLDLQVQKWPNPPTLSIEKPLYLDSLAISYLQIVGLLDETLATFKDVWTDDETARRANQVVAEDKDAAAVLGLIDNIAANLAAEIPERVSIGKLRAAGEKENELDSPTINLLGDVSRFTTVVFDDRALNKEPFAADELGRQARMANSLDLLMDLEKRQAITPAQHYELLRKLRKAGAMLIPVGEAEAIYAAKRSADEPSLELKTIAESILLARIAKLPRFPMEVPWFANTTLAIKNAIYGMWDDMDRARAAGRSDLLHELIPDPEDWWFAWHATIDPSWAEATWRAVISSLGLPLQLKDDQDAVAYNAWAERTIWTPMRAYHPQRYAKVIEHIRNFVATSVDAAPDEGAQDD